MTTKRISAELTGDNAIRAEIIFLSTGLSKEPKNEAGTIFCKLALLCIEKAIEDCRKTTGTQYPSHSQVMEFICGDAQLQKG